MRVSAYQSFGPSTSGTAGVEVLLEPSEEGYVSYESMRPGKALSPLAFGDLRLLVEDMLIL